MEGENIYIDYIDLPWPQSLKLGECWWTWDPCGWLVSQQQILNGEMPALLLSRLRFWASTAILLSPPRFLPVTNSHFSDRLTIKEVELIEFRTETYRLNDLQGSLFAYTRKPRIGPFHLRNSLSRVRGWGDRVCSRDRLPPWTRARLGLPLIVAMPSSWSLQPNYVDCT